MTTKHTPGPWTVIGNEVRWLADDETVTTITELEDLTLRQAANARLIAAAPDLLDALRRVMRHIPTDAGGASLSDDMHRARKAIARALA